MASAENLYDAMRLAVNFEMAIRCGDERYWKLVDFYIDCLKDGVSIDGVIDVLCHENEGELVAYIMQRRKGIGSNTEEEL